MYTMIFTTTTHVATYGDAALVGVGSTIYGDDNTPYTVLEAGVWTRGQKQMQLITVAPQVNDDE